MFAKIENPTREDLIPYLGRNIKCGNRRGKLVIVSERWVGFDTDDSCYKTNIKNELRLLVMPKHIGNIDKPIAWYNFGGLPHSNISVEVYDVTRPAGEQASFLDSLNDNQN
jgi:hypothetical protein